MSLRAELIEAAMKAAYESDARYIEGTNLDFPPWETLDDWTRGRFRVHAEAAVDAVLEYLAENTEQ